MAGNKILKIKFSPVDIEARKALDFRAGDTVNVSSKILDEKGKYRLQSFEGIVLARKHGIETGATFTVRKVASGVGVERIFPLYSPLVDKIEVTKKAKARRSKLYYIRDKAVKDVRRKMRSVAVEEMAAEAQAEPVPEVSASE
jgi:large subunit ribosomal protein L19